MAGLKGFIQFISIIFSVFLLVWVCNADYHAALFKASDKADMYSEWTVKEENSEFYTVYNGKKYYFTGSITQPQDKELNRLDSNIKAFLKIESLYAQDEGSSVISFTGDCSLGSLNGAGSGSRFYKYVKESGATYPFNNVKQLFENDSFTFVNLEGTLTTQTKQARKTYRIKGEPEWASSMLAASSIEGVTLANNHSYDYLKEGYEETMQALEDAGIAYAVQNLPVVAKAGKTDVIIIVGNYVDDGVKVGLRGNALTQSITGEIKKYKNPKNIVIVVCHWGSELEEKPSSDQRNCAHAFIDAGADMVLGHHPHVLQGIEKYADKYIFYSLGNFAFAGNSTVNNTNKKSMIVRPRIAVVDDTAQITGYSIVPCYTTSGTTSANNFQPIPLFGKKAQELSDYLIKLSSKISGGVESIDVPTTVIDAE